MSMATSLTFSQSRAIGEILEVWPRHSIIHFQAPSGRGRTTVVGQLHQQLGGGRLSTIDFVSAQALRDPLAFEDTIFQVLTDALRRHEHVFLDDLHVLLALCNDRCSFYPRSGYIHTVLEAVSSAVTGADRKLLLASEDDTPAALTRRAVKVAMQQCVPEDYRLLCQSFGGARLENIDVNLVYRFAPRLDAYQIRDACRKLEGHPQPDAEAFIHYLRQCELVSNVELTEVAPMRLEDLKGIDDVVESILANVVVPMENDRLAQDLQLAPKRGVLLLGPPGTGKTSIGKALAHRLRGKFFLIDGSIISGTSSFYYEVQQIFEAAKENAPAVIFIDDSDVIFDNRSEHGLYRYLLTMLDGLEGESNGRVCVMITAMDLRNVPPALIRSGRVELWLETRMPDVAARQEILRSLADRLPESLKQFDLPAAAESTEHCSGADIKRILEDAKCACAYALSQQRTPPTLDDAFRSAVAAFRRNQQRYREAEEQARRQRPDRPVWYDLAVHEA